MLGDEILADCLAFLLARAADAWALGDWDAVDRLIAGAWRIVADAEVELFTDNARGAG